MLKFFFAAVRAIHISAWSVVCLVSVLAPTRSFAASKCEIGSTLFQDAAYGGIAGAVVSSLVLIVNKSSSQVPQTIAASTLVGIGVGFGVGIWEASYSDCMQQRVDNQQSSDQQPTRHAASLHITPAFEFSPKNTLLGGLNLSYDL